jgi:hypothetical protein
MNDTRRTLRMMEPRDVPALIRITAAQNRRDHTSYPFPNVFEMEGPRIGQMKANVLLALVTEVNGRVRQGHVWLRTVEQMDFGGGREDTEFAIQHMPAVFDVLKRRGYEDVHVFVPRRRLWDFETILEDQGLTRQDPRLAHFFTSLNAAESEALEHV